jgi:uncharacterized protein YciI
MLFAVFFTDDPTHTAARKREMPAHLDFLDAHAREIRAAGPLRDKDDPASSGGLWLVEAADHETVVALYRSDPFWPTGLRKSVRVFEWTQVFADGSRRI